MNSRYRLLLDPLDTDLEDVFILRAAKTVNDLYQAASPLIHQAADFIYAESEKYEMLPDRISNFDQMADAFEVYVPGVLMLSWKAARALVKSEFTKNTQNNFTP